MKKTKKSGSKDDLVFANIRGRINAQGNIRRGLVSLKNGIKSDLARIVVPRLLALSAYRSMLAPSAFPVSWNAVQIGPKSNFVEYEHELIWACAILTL